MAERKHSSLHDPAAELFHGPLLVEGVAFRQPVVAQSDQLLQTSGCPTSTIACELVHIPYELRVLELTAHDMFFRRRTLTTRRGCEPRFKASDRVCGPVVRPEVMSQSDRACASRAPRKLAVFRAFPCQQQKSADASSSRRHHDSSSAKTTCVDAQPNSQRLHYSTPPYGEEGIQSRRRTRDFRL